MKAETENAMFSTGHKHQARFDKKSRQVSINTNTFLTTEVGDTSVTHTYRQDVTSTIQTLNNTTSYKHKRMGS